QGDSEPAFFWRFHDFVFLMVVRSQPWREGDRRVPAPAPRFDVKICSRLQTRFCLRRPSTRHADGLLGIPLPVADDLLAFFEVVAIENEANRRVELRLFDVWVVPPIRCVAFHPCDRALDTPRCRFSLCFAIFVGAFHGLNLAAEAVYTIVEDGD